ncbi:MAG: hypothetical protein U1E36_01245 [Rickettsiales bacterium]
MKKSTPGYCPLNEFKAILKNCGGKLFIVTLITLLVPYFIPAAVSSIVGIYGWFLFLIPGSLVWAYLLFLPLHYY